jgi:hypothetical protein
LNSDCRTLNEAKNLCRAAGAETAGKAAGAQAAEANAAPVDS